MPVDSAQRFVQGQRCRYVSEQYLAALHLCRTDGTTIGLLLPGSTSNEASPALARCAWVSPDCSQQDITVETESQLRREATIRGPATLFARDLAPTIGRSGRGGGGQSTGGLSIDHRPRAKFSVQMISSLVVCPNSDGCR